VLQASELLVLKVRLDQELQALMVPLVQQAQMERPALKVRQDQREQLDPELLVLMGLLVPLACKALLVSLVHLVLLELTVHLDQLVLLARSVRPALGLLVLLALREHLALSVLQALKVLPVLMVQPALLVLPVLSGLSARRLLVITLVVYFRGRRQHL